MKGTKVQYMLLLFNPISFFSNSAIAPQRQIEPAFVLSASRSSRQPPKR